MGTLFNVSMDLIAHKVQHKLVVRSNGEQHCICYAAFNATAVALSAVESVPKSDPTADSATAVALNAA